jgi:uncharacterized protein (TIGR02171 family)
MKWCVILMCALSGLFCACSSSDKSTSQNDAIDDELPDEPNLDSLTLGDTLSVKDSLDIEDTLAKEEVVPAGMLLMKAKGATVVLESMKVKFSYDFWISKSEVTCGEFNALMKPATGLALACENDSLPATDLTYYDAVLLANERSKAEGFDTAYTYLKKYLDSDKHCVRLEGFEYVPARKAVHLPTEAEWIFAAKQDWNPQENAWTADNSDYKLHPVCSKAKEDEICDMAGNALEWVNDWFGRLRDTSVTNFVGAPDGGSLGQRVVKGGSYRNQAALINVLSRGDIYTVTSVAREDYVGFRLAYGDIPDAVWMGDNGRVASSKVTPLANATSLYSYTETYKTKLVFRNEETGNLSYIDYSNGALSVVEIVDTLEAYHPEISPDGNHVAFCTQFEGNEGESSLYVRDLNAEGSNLVKLNVKSAAIPRWRVLENGDTVIVYVTDVGVNKSEATFLSNSTWQVPFANGKFGTPQKLFDGAYHGGISDDDRLAVTGARLLRARVDDRDTLWYNGEQACNVSLSKDGQKQTLFLDFASATGKNFVGSKYSAHQYIFVADSSGKLIQSVAAPKGFTFDHTEWVAGDGRLTVATLTNSNGSHTEIVLVNMSDGSVVELAKGNELWHPNLWVYTNPRAAENKTLDKDSAGVYMNPEDALASYMMRNNMELLWRYRDSANVVILGSSRPLNALSPKEFSSPFFAVNFAHVPNSIYASHDYLERYLLVHLKKLKYIVISLDIDFWYKTDGPESDNFFATSFYDYPGYVYDANHDYWKDGYPDGLLESTENAISMVEYDRYFGDRGRFMANECYSWGDTVEITLDSTYYDDKMYLIENSLETLKKIIEMAAEKDIYVVGLILPQNPKYKETGAFGRYGLRRSVAKTIIEEIAGYKTLYPNFALLDENKMGEHDYPDDMALDFDHLCAEGAPKITSRVDSLLKTLK